MKKQSTNTILMIEPVAFGYNQQTAVNNYFQQQLYDNTFDIQQFALMEFKEMVRELRANGIDVILLQDTFEPHTPDSIFPNNWVSFHEGGQVILYPMFAPNRRLERRKDIVQIIEEWGKTVNNVDDFTFGEDENQFLEGTGSLVLDRVNKVAYAALSERTDKSLFLQFCETFDFDPVCFIANQSVDNQRLPIYHTNIMMSVANEFAVICTDSIDNEYERKIVMYSLEKTGKDIITISESQMHCFAGNVLQVENREGKRFLVISRTAYDSLNEKQIERLSAYNELIICSIPTIERVGGGSVRCMLAEVF